MIDLLLGAALSTSSNDLDQVMSRQIVAQAATVYLPTSTTQSRNPKCVAFRAVNTLSSAVKNVYVNYNDQKGKPHRRWLSLNIKPGKSVSFDLCQGQSLINVEAKQR